MYFFRFFPFLFLCYGFIGLGATIKKINKDKSIIQIDTGGDKSYQKDARVCFKENSVIVGCGKVTIVKKNIAAVEVDKNALIKIKNGSEVYLDDTVPTGGKVPHFVVRGFWAGPVIPQVSFHDISYIPQDLTSPQEPYWAQGPAASALAMSFGIEIEVPKIKSSIGFRYRSFSTKVETTNYDLSTDSQGVTVEPTSQASALGFYADYYILKFFGFRLGAGLDLDMSNVHYTINKNDPENGATAIIEFQSSLKEYSLRLPLRYEKTFGSSGVFGVFAGATFLLPLAGSPEYTSNISESETNLLNTDTEIKEKLAHQKESFGMDLTIGIQMGL